eukprot:gene3489-3948_t
MSTQSKETDHLCNLARGEHFVRSYTNNDQGGKVVSNERTSQFMHLDKSHDRWVGQIERRAAELVGLEAAFVEPLQL